MNIREISKKITSATLNESLAQKFGTNLDLEKFNFEQLEDARNKLRSQVRDIETNESFDAVHTESYQKSKLFLDVLNQAIIERADEKGIPTAEDLAETIVTEGEEDKAQLVMASKDMVDKLTGWMEDTAEMQSESMLELADAIRDEMGSETAEAFTASIKPALDALYAEMEVTRIALTGGVGMLTGEGEPVDTMGAEEPDMDMEEPAMEPTDDMDDGDAMADMDDGMGASAPAAGGDEPAGRPQRESIQRSRKLGQVLSKKKK
jgi:hypothetical protein|tara:strand:- start:246 stop:1034 length:789 start_codon:yes stop_codon:yes gene_type:complete